MAVELPDALLAFVVENFESVYQLEVLLHVRERGESSAEVVARALYMPPPSVRAALEGLVERGLAERAAGGAYRCEPRSAASAALIEAVALRYGDYRVRIAGAIYSNREEPRLSPLRSFAEAFRLRKDREGGGGGTDG